jgi:Cof subfamily protein (haloacid dehalogenase superfamily)
MSKKINTSGINTSGIRALALDLDGTTLLPDATLGERTQGCLRKLISNGMQVMFATGRAIESSQRYFSAIGAQGPMVFFNGAEVADIPSGKILSTNLIGIEVADFGIDMARSMGIHYQIYLPAGISPETGKIDPQRKWETLIIDRQSPESESYYKHTGLAAVVKDLKNIAVMPDLKGCLKGMFIVDPSLHDEIRKRMYERFGDQINVIRSFPTYLEILNNGVSKGEGLKIAMEHSGLQPQEVIAFGDEENDLSMFEAAGFSAAPASARDKIREAADVIYPSIAEEGLAVWLEETFG